jgi:nicotinate-nucleotide adenylyltransferase
MTIRAFMGGTFDPVHYGHLRIADRLRASLGLAELALLPTAMPPHKPLDSMTPAEHRVAMVQLSLKEFPALTLCALELTDSIAFTVDTLRTLREGPPATDPVFVVGMDSVAELSTWHDYRGLLAEFDLIAIARPGHDQLPVPDYDPFVVERIRPAIEPLEAQRLIEDEQLGRGGRIFPLKLPAEAISSREIRRRTAAGEALEGLVPADVALYIQRHDLYVRGVRP